MDNCPKSLFKTKTKELKLMVFCLFLFAKFSLCFSQTYNISNANQYPIDDPRNPNCPCHQHQKLAEQQYLSNISDDIQQMINMKRDDKLGLFDTQRKVSLMESLVIASNSKEVNFRNGLSYKSKGKKNLFVKFFYSIKHVGRIKRKRAVNACFKWV